MKTIILLIALIVSAAKGIYAQTQDTVIYNRDYYMERSKANKASGNILLIGGLGAAVLGLAIGTGNSDGLDMDFTGPAIFLGGLGAALISIPFYVSSRQNLIKAMNLSAGVIRVKDNPGSHTASGFVQPAAVLRIRIR